MRFTISETYELITPESAEQGDYADAGFNYEGAVVSWRELVETLESYGYSESSCYPARPGDRFWVTAYGDQDPYTGGYINTSLHLRETSQRHLRYWYKACHAAGIKLGGASCEH